MFRRLLTPSGPVDVTMVTKHRDITHIIRKTAGAPVNYNVNMNSIDTKKY